MNFESFSTDNIENETPQALGFYISATRYLEEGSSCFTDITDLELTTKPAMVDNLSQVVTDSEEEVVKKKNKRMAKRKKWLVKLSTLIKSLLSSCPESSLFLLSYSVPTPVPVLMPALVPTPLPAPVSYLRSLAVLSSGRVPALAVFVALFLLCHTPISYCKILALLLPLFVLGPPLFLEPSPLVTFK